MSVFSGASIENVLNREETMNLNSTTIFDQIAERVVQRLELDDNFSDETVGEIRRLFETGEIVDQDKVRNALEGNSNENI